MARSAATTTQDFVADVHLAELSSAVSRADMSSVSSWGERCASQGIIDCRCLAHGTPGIFALTATPLWLAVYKRDRELAAVLLTHGADPNAVATRCRGSAKACNVGGRAILHLATARGQHAICTKLLALGATADAPMCFPIDEADEPEWDPASEDYVGGLAGSSALELAASRDEDLCALLLAHGGDGAALVARAGADPKRRSLLRTVRGEDGQARECAICLSEVFAISCAFTPCCLQAFHPNCLRGLQKCPLCRTVMENSVVGAARPGGGGGAAAVNPSVPAGSEQSDHERPEGELEYSGRTILGMPTRGSGAHRVEDTLEAAFAGSWWGNQAGRNVQVDCNSVMGTNYGWRTGGPNSTLYTA